MNDAEREKKMFEIAANEMNLDAVDVEAYRTIGLALRQVADAGVDSGVSAVSADFWATIGGVEYFMTVRRSNNQLAKDAN